MMRSVSSLLVAVLALALAACAVGPDFKRPDKPGMSSYESAPLLEKTESAPGEGGAAQRFAQGQDIPSVWWELFRSQPLNHLIAQAFRANPDLQAAEAALRVASEDAAARTGVLFPSISANFDTARQKISGAGGGGQFKGSIFSVHNASVNVAYGLDLFGGTRRSVEVLAAQEEYQKFQVEAARISLSTNVVTTAVQEASLRGQIAATKAIIERQTQQRDLLQQQMDLGAINRAAVLAQETALAQTRATLPPLEKQLAQLRHALSVLVGQFPNEEPKGMFELSSLKLPETLPVTLPSQLVEQRPDIRAAEANLHAASAAIGVAIANRLPQITLSASIGTEANDLSRLFSSGSGIWSLGGGVAQKLFDAGTLAHRQGSAEAQYDVAAAQYRKVVLAAFQDVADTLRALQADAVALRAQTEAAQAASENLRLAEEQYKMGAISYLALLDAQQAEQQTQIALVQARALRFADTAALFQALGGGWWNRAADTNQSMAARTP
ncbi:MAG: efflux transporter outer membrane subunit [Alphaproteobacteria bacterium]|nr:efflux transporter outer membrane subunit [Alphaproteobacteria bacterium]